jgi:hypothetical protein
MTWYKTGTTTLTNGSAVISGSGTLWVDAGVLFAGDIFAAPDGKLYEILSIQSNTGLTLASNYLGATASGQAYAIMPIGLLPSALALQVKTVLNSAQAAVTSSVLYTAAQGLTTPQQAAARANIAAYGAGDAISASTLSVSGVTQFNDLAISNNGKGHYWYEPGTTTWMRAYSPSANILSIGGSYGEVISLSASGLSVTGVLTTTGNIASYTDADAIKFGTNGAVGFVAATRSGGNYSSLELKTSGADGNGLTRATLDTTGLSVTGALSVPQITFPATQVPSANANTLDDYEEGTWTPTQGGGLTVVGTFTSIGSYLKIGNQVTVWGRLLGSTSVAAAANAVMCAGLPFVSAVNGMGAGLNSIASGLFGVWVDSSVTVYSSGFAATPSVAFTATYTV